jgi:hypothetical protein
MNVGLTGVRNHPRSARTGNSRVLRPIPNLALPGLTGKHPERSALSQAEGRVVEGGASFDCGLSLRSRPPLRLHPELHPERSRRAAEGTLVPPESVEPLCFAAGAS